jgi:hypothetical protein
MINTPVINNAINLNRRINNIAPPKAPLKILERSSVYQLKNTGIQPTVPSSNFTKENFVKTPIQNAYSPGPFVEDVQGLRAKLGFTKLSNSAGNDISTATSYRNTTMNKAAKPDMSKSHGLSLSAISDIPELQTGQTGNEFNKTVADKKLQSELTLRQTMIDDFGKELRRKRPPGSIQTTGNSRS